MEPGYPKTRGNPPVFKPVNLGLCAGKKLGLTILIFEIKDVNWCAHA